MARCPCCDEDTGERTINPRTGEQDLCIKCLIASGIYNDKVEDDDIEYMIEEVDLFGE